MSDNHDAVNADDSLSDFACFQPEFVGRKSPVYTKGVRPAVIVLHEIPGISPQAAWFARWVSETGFTVYMPSLFSRIGGVPAVAEGKEVFQRVCISREFSVLAGQGTSPVVDWLRTLAQLAAKESGFADVGVVGMCLTGNFALSMMIEPAVKAPVICQPSLPLDAPDQIELSDVDVQKVAQRFRDEDLSVRAFRFEGDHFCPAARFAKYRKMFGKHFVEASIPDSAADLPLFSQAHSHASQCDYTASV